MFNDFIIFLSSLVQLDLFTYFIGAFALCGVGVLIRILWKGD